MRKNKIRLTESQLHDIIRESIHNVLKEYGNTASGQAALGALQQRREQQAREKALKHGALSDETGQLYDKADEIRAYAAKQRGNDKELANANQRGREAQHSYYNHGINKDQRNHALRNNTWKNMLEQD